MCQLRNWTQDQGCPCGMKYKNYHSHPLPHGWTTRSQCNAHNIFADSGQNIAVFWIEHSTFPTKYICHVKVLFEWARLKSTFLQTNGSLQSDREKCTFFEKYSSVHIHDVFTHTCMEWNKACRGVCAWHRSWRWYYHCTTPLSMHLSHRDGPTTDCFEIRENSFSFLSFLEGQGLLFSFCIHSGWIQHNRLDTECSFFRTKHLGDVWMRWCSKCRTVISVFSFYWDQRTNFKFSSTTQKCLEWFWFYLGGTSMSCPAIQSHILSSWQQIWE